MGFVPELCFTSCLDEERLSAKRIEKFSYRIDYNFIDVIRSMQFDLFYGQNQITLYLNLQFYDMVQMLY